MLRFAPSPTGDMHIETLRIALFNAIISIQRDEPLIVRIEDGDQENNIEGKDKELIGLLSLFNIEYRDVIHQSNHLKYHRTMALQLLHDKRAFSCFCTPAELDAKREVAKKNSEAYHYDDTCTYLRAEETIDNMNPFTIRLRRPEKEITVVDKVQGETTFSTFDVDSFIIMSQNKYPTHNFASAVDDMISDISLVIRSADYIDDTPRQIAIRNALGYDKDVQYAHLPIMLNSEGKKIEEQDNTSNVKWLLEEGYLPEAISNYLILIGNKTPTEVFTLKEAVDWFKLESISKSPAHFDIEKLRWINREHLKRLDAKELSRYVGFADDDIGALAKIYLEEVGTLKELRSKIEPIFAPKEIPEVYEESVDTLRCAIKEAPYFDEYGDFEKHIKNVSGLKDTLYLKSLYLVLTGTQDGPEIANIYKHLKNYLAEVVK
ncbi:MAG: glutamate--tRNA ligase [Campylobacterota bacterium]|nr:glutamate--tRNA ligase [Campylobacterota bacterium]